MTGFGRTGVRCKESQESQKLPHELPACSPATTKACSRISSASPKGLTGGYLPMAATLTTQKVFDAFLGEYDEFKTFFHGHSFTGNQLGAAAALASLEILQSQASAPRARSLQRTLARGIENASGRCRTSATSGRSAWWPAWNWCATGARAQPFDLRERAGIRVCEAMARRGVLTRPIGNVIVLMPPYCTTPKQVRRMVAVLAEAIGEVFCPKGSRRGNGRARKATGTVDHFRGFPQPCGSQTVAQ